MQTLWRVTLKYGLNMQTLMYLDIGVTDVHGVHTHHYFSQKVIKCVVAALSDRIDI